MVAGSAGSFDPCTYETSIYKYYERPNIKLEMQTSSINENSSSTSNIFIYPNPTNGIINIKNPYKIHATIEILNSVGQIIFSKQLNKTINIQKIDLSGYSEEIYLLKIHNNHNMKVEKLIIQ
jgi:hypothetical protein